jgi:hypothetical protein
MKVWKIVPLVLGLLITACSSVNLRYDYDVRANFASYKTFDWYAASRMAKDKGVKVDNPLMDRRVANAVEKELTTRGYTRDTTSDPDFLVTYYPIYQEKKYRTATQVGWGSWGFRPFGFGMGTTVSQEQRYREGTIVLEITDFKTNQMVWQAAAEGVLTDLKNPEDADEVVNNAVKQMLDHFPPKK